MTTQAPTPGPLDSESVKLLVKGDWLLPSLSGATPKQFDHIGSTVRDTPLLFFVDGGSCLASVANFIGRPEADGWMPWSGGENPVPGQAVEWSERDEGPQLAAPSNRLRWDHGGHGCDIIAFRLAPTAPVEASGSGWEQVRAEIEKAFAEGITPQEIIALFRPQPSGETLEAVARIIHRNEFEGQAWEDATEAYRQHVLKTASDILSTRPLALGGQHSSATDFPPDDVLACMDDTTPARAEAQDEGAAGKWPEVTDQWAETYCDLTGQNPDGAQVSFIGDGAVTTTFRDKAKRQIEAMLCAAPKAAVRAISAHPSPTPAADADRVREAVTIIRDRLRQIWEGDTHLVYSGNPPEPSHDEEGDLAKLANEAVEALNSVFPVPDPLTALKSTAAKEGDVNERPFTPRNAQRGLSDEC